jgi:hypothetical protein
VPVGKAWAQATPVSLSHRSVIYRVSSRQGLVSSVLFSRAAATTNTGAEGAARASKADIYRVTGWWGGPRIRPPASSLRCDAAERALSVQTYGATL